MRNPKAVGGRRRRGAQGAWRSRAPLGFLLSLLIYLVPVAASVAVALVVSRVLPRGSGLPATVAWWAGVFAASTLALFLSERVTRRFLPLAGLLKITMVFPDRAPSRLAVAWRAATTRDLQRRLATARSAPPSDADEAAAEILALAGALNLHDRRTRGHSERVRALTDMLADELKLPAADRDKLRWSALLHDIGKLHVHPDILNKDGRPTPEEWESLRRHPLEGAALIAPLQSWLGEWALTVEQHHEQFDGSGYPFGLSGQAISHGARIVAVADSFEVMTALRSYKAPMSATAARQELVACSGSQFDPVIVRAFLNVSLGRLRWTLGPLGWLSDLVVLRSIPNLPRLAQVVAGAAHQAAAAVVVAAGVVVAATSAASPAALVHRAASGASGAAAASDRCRSCAGPGGAGASGARQGTAPVGARAGVASTSDTAGSTSTTGTGGTGAAGPTSGGGSGVGSGAGAASSSGSATSSGTSATGSGVGGSGGSGTTTTSSSPTTTGAQTAGTPGSLALVNSGGAPGRADQGDTIVVVFAQPVAASSLCSSWTASSHPDLGGANVTIDATHPAAGDDEITGVFDPSACPGGFHFGTVDLGQSGFFSTSVTFGGSGPQCTGSVTSGCSTIHWDGANTLTITLGKPSGTDHADATPVVATYTPDPALGVATPLRSAPAVQF